MRREFVCSTLNHAMGRSHILTGDPAPQAFIPTLHRLGAVGQIPPAFWWKNAAGAGYIGPDSIRSSVTGQQLFSGQLGVAVSILHRGEVLLGDGQVFDQEGSVADPKSVAQGTVAARHDHNVHTFRDRSLHEIVGAQQIGLERRIESMRSGSNARLVGGVGPRSQMLYRLNAPHCPQDVIIVFQNSPDPLHVIEFTLWFSMGKEVGFEVPVN